MNRSVSFNNSIIVYITNKVEPPHSTETNQIELNIRIIKPRIIADINKPMEIKKTRF